MKSWLLFQRSVLLVFDNFLPALRITILPFAIAAAGFVLLFQQFFDAASAPGEVTIPTSFFPLFILVFLLCIAVWLWIVVAWHRYILLEESSGSWIPKWNGAEMLSYFGRAFLLSLAMIPISFVILGVLSAVLGGTGNVAALFIVGALASAIVGIFFFRICAILPAAALGKNLTFGEAWAATKGEAGTAVGLGILFYGGSYLLNLPLTMGGPQSGLIALVYSVVVSWVTTMVGVSILSTVYGHYIEGRALE